MKFLLEGRKMETIVRRELVGDKRICRYLAAGVFVVLTALSAFVRLPLPFTPVPLTLQTFFVLLSGALLGKKWGVSTQSAYLFLGLCGQQVFTGLGSGSLYFWGVTGGYLAGFVPAAFLAGSLLKGEKEGFLPVFLKLLAADFVILFSGTLWLKITGVLSVRQAFLLGFVPFAAGDMLKVALAAVVYRKTQARFKSALY
ncbi:MAG: biotin transporter BioY [Candidatus Omnitrophica bacterium]|nr:biotin transporter BioY [Candidatus Omnitrophota bacterium]